MECGHKILRISDFGCAVQFDPMKNPSGMISCTAGTPAFWAPESISIDFSSGNPSEISNQSDTMVQDGNEDNEEVIAEDSTDTSPNFSAYLADIWAAGVTLYCFLFGQHPFLPTTNDENIIALLEMIVQYEPSYAIPNSEAVTDINSDVVDFSLDEVKSTLQNILLKDPTKRCTLDSIYDAGWVRRIRDRNSFYELNLSRYADI